MLTVQIIAFWVVAGGSTAVYFWKQNKKWLKREAIERAHEEAWVENGVRSWEETRQQDLELIRQNNALWDEIMRKNREAIEEFEKHFGPSDTWD